MVENLQPLHICMQIEISRGIANKLGFLSTEVQHFAILFFTNRAIILRADKA